MTILGSFETTVYYYNGLWSPLICTNLIIDRTEIRKKSRQKLRPGRRVEEVESFSSVTTVSEEAAIIGPSGRRINQVDQVVQAPERFNGSSALVVIRSFCRFAPLESDSPHCRKPDPLYFYNVTSATCEPFYGGYCQRSRNRFRNVPDCLKVIATNIKFLIILEKIWQENISWCFLILLIIFIGVCRQCQRIYNSSIK